METTITYWHYIGIIFDLIPDLYTSSSSKIRTRECNQDTTQRKLESYREGSDPGFCEHPS